MVIFNLPGKYATLSNAKHNKFNQLFIEISKKNILKQHKENMLKF